MGPQLLHVRRQRDAAFSRPMYLCRSKTTCSAGQSRMIPATSRFGRRATQWSSIDVAAQPHFRDQLTMAQHQPAERRRPARCFRMASVTRLAVGQDRIDTMKFAVLAKQALAIQISGRHIPNPHWLGKESLTASRLAAFSAVPEASPPGSRLDPAVRRIDKRIRCVGLQPGVLGRHVVLGGMIAERHVAGSERTSLNVRLNSFSMSGVTVAGAR